MSYTISKGSWGISFDPGLDNVKLFKISHQNDTEIFKIISQFTLHDFESFNDIIYSMSSYIKTLHD